MDQEPVLLAEAVTKLDRDPGAFRDPGSFRDPSGFVCHLDGQVFRAIDRDCSARFRRLEHSGLLRALERSGGLIPTRLVDPSENVYRTLHRYVPQVADYLHHEKVPFVGYPYEWTQSMLADAALCCLDLQLLLMEHGYSLKDASAYNVQFVKGRPVFIDVPSIETVPRRDVWMALDQFCRMFLYPLLLSRHGRGDLRGYFLAHLDGMSLDDVHHRFGLFGATRPRLWLDLLLPYHLQRFAAGKPKAMRTRAATDRTDTRALAWNLRRLRRKIKALRGGRAQPSAWVDYARSNTYTSEETQRKEDFIGRFLDEHPANRVLDLGCNTGRFTEVATRRGASVVAVDSDAGCVDRLYQKTREQGWDVTPLVVNIASPSPGTGYRNVERASFLSRASFDCVFALALVHHLLVTSRLPVGSIVDLLADLTTRHVIVEFIEPGDDMFVSLLGARENLYRHLTCAHFIGECERRFEVLSQTGITEHRTLVALRKKA